MTKTTPNSQLARESYDEKFDRMKGRKEERDSKATRAEQVFQDLAKRFVAERADEYDYMRDLMLDAHEKLLEEEKTRQFKESCHAPF